MAKAKASRIDVITLTLSIDEAITIEAALDTIGTTDLVDSTEDMQCINDVRFALYCARESIERKK